MRAAVLRTLAFVIPLAASVVAGTLLAARMPSTSSLGGAVLVWLAVIAVSTAVMLATDRVTRRLLPIATLLKLSMIFPDQAPTRFKVARRSSGTRALAAELEQARVNGVTGDRQQAAETILALVGALGDYDGRTRGHSERTQLFVQLLAEQLRLKDADRDRLLWAALVHDVGKLEVPNDVLNKAGKPDDEEWALLQRHPVDGATICAPLAEWLGPWVLAVEEHHERYDGTGYPHGLRGEQISLAGRIVSVADAYEVMTAARPYKKAMTPVAAREELARCAGTHFDPAIVRAFLNISLGRLRLAAGPLSWAAQLPLLQPLPSLGQAAGVVASTAATAAGTVVLGLSPVAAGVTSAAAAPPAAVAPAPATAPAASAPEVPLLTRGSDTVPELLPSEFAEPFEEPVEEPVTVRPAGFVGPLPVEEPAPVPTPEPTPEPTPGPTTPPEPQPAAPVTADDALTVAEDAAATPVDVLANDTDADGDALVVASVTQPEHGTVTLAAGQVSYAPDADHSGPDPFTYVADDGGLTATGSVLVTVTPVADAPVPGADGLVVAEDSAATTVDVLANDSDPDAAGLSVVAVTQPSSGTVTLVDGVVSYTPGEDANGPTAFTYDVVSGSGDPVTGTVDVTVTPVADAPVASDDAFAVMALGSVDGNVLLNDGDEDGDALTVLSDDAPVVDVAPNGDFTFLGTAPGTTTFTYVVSDGALTGSATVTVTTTALPPSSSRLYLRGGPAAWAAMTETAPTESSGDWDGDGAPGRTIRSSNMWFAETDPRRVGVWTYTVPAAGLDLNGPVALELFGSTEGRARRDLDYSAWLYDCNASGTSCRLLTRALDVHVDDWNRTASWEKRTVPVGSASTTVAPGRVLQLRVSVHHIDLWLALDASRPSALVLPAG